MSQRLMTDLVGTFYTLVLELTIPNMGAFAYFKDSEGNVMGLWEVLM